MHIKIGRSIAIVILIIMAAIAPALAIPQEINFQGRLLGTGGTPKTGFQVIEFRLCDSPAGGTTITTLTKSVSCDAEGIFSTPLDFSASYFTGAERYLELMVVGDTLPLSPRERITSFPYAYRAITAESYLGTFVTGISSAGAASIKGDVILEPGQNVSIGRSGQKIIISAEAALGFVSKTGDRMTGNLKVQNSFVSAETYYGNGAGLTGITPGMSKAEADGYYVNVGGDTMTGSLNLPANGLVAQTTGLVASGGKVGIGTASPSSTLTVASGYIHSTSGGFRFPDSITQTTAVAGGGGDAWTDLGTFVRIKNAGDYVGIGTVTPSQKLEVNGTARFSAGITVEGTVTIPTGSINGSAIQAGTVTNTQIKDSSVTNSQIGSGAITNNAVVTGTIQGPKLAADCVTTNKINNYTIGATEIAADSVITDKIINESVNASQRNIKYYCVGDSELMDSGNWDVTGLGIESSVLYIDGTNNRVGIGTSSPPSGYSLYVAGDVKSTSSTNPLLNLRTGTISGTQSDTWNPFSSQFSTQCYGITICRNDVLNGQGMYYIYNVSSSGFRCMSSIYTDAPGGAYYIAYGD